MDVQKVIDKVRYTTGDQSALQFTNDQIIDWINDGIRECAVQNNLLQKRATSSTVAGTNDYALPSDILKFHSVKYDNKKLNFMTLQEFDEYYNGVGVPASSDRGTPEVCYVWAGNLTLYPAPDAVKNLVIDYLYTPALHTSGALNVELALPVGYHSRIVDYCLAQVAQQDDDMNRYAAKMQEFKTGIQDLKDQPENTYDLYPSISVSDRDAGEGVDYLW